MKLHFIFFIICSSLLILEIILYLLSNKNNSSSLSKDISNDITKPFTMFDWNVAGLPVVYDIKGLKTKIKVNKFSDPNQRVNDILSEILSYNPDVICLQEVFDTKFGNKIKRKLETEGYNVLWMKSKKFFDTISCGLLTATKGKFAGHMFHSYTNEFGEDSSANKGFLYTRIKLNDDNYISVVNTHLQATAIYSTSSVMKILFYKLFKVKQNKEEIKKLSNNTKEKQLKELLNFIKTVSDIQFLGNDTFFITGDVNSTKRTERLKTFNAELKVLTENNVSTLDTEELNTCCIDNFHIQYDHMFVFNKNTKLPKITFSTSKQDENFFMSDHKPLITVLS